MFIGCSYLTNVSSDRKDKCHGICLQACCLGLLKNKPTKKPGQVRVLES